MLDKHMSKIIYCDKKIYGLHSKIIMLLNSKTVSQIKIKLPLMMLFLHLVHTVKTTGDVNVSEGTIGAVVGPGAHIGQASFVSQLHPPSKDEGVYLIHLSTIYFNRGRERMIGLRK